MKANNRTTDECLTEMLKHWLNCDPSWSDLVQALSSEPVGEKTVARQIHTKYCTAQKETDAGNETTGDDNYIIHLIVHSIQWYIQYSGKYLCGGKFCIFRRQVYR